MQIFNTLTKKKEQFIPIHKNHISMYVCGQTVYDFCHMGHARKELVFDMIRRWFIASGYKVKYVVNITDIEDKIILRANENNETIYQLTERIIGYMHEDLDALGIMRPDYEPRATDYIPQMLNIIDDLVDKGYAYHAQNGDVYYKVRKFVGYGKLSGKSLDDLQAGERVDIDQNKQDPLDFVLWKSSKENEPAWESKFGSGRPGWHIECSAMSEYILGKHFDIHGGGQDLQFPHHENEIAQSEAHNGCKFANYWMHNGFLNINDEKMSKSLGNFFTLRDVLGLYHPEVIRLFMLRTHYRSPLNYSLDNMDDAKIGLTRMYTAMNQYALAKNEDYVIDWSSNYANKFKNAMDDDFNTPLAISILFDMVSELNKHNNIELYKLFISLANVLGLLNISSQEFFQAGVNISTFDIDNLIEERKLAKQNKDFVKSDSIREQLLSQGIILEDTAKGTIWRKI